VTVVELAFAVSLLGLLTIVVAFGMERQLRGLGAVTAEANHGLSAAAVFDRVVQELRLARVVSGSSLLSSGIGAADTELELDSSLGFPPSGFLVLDPGSDSAELVAYGALGEDGRELRLLSRGQQGTTASAHSAGTPVFWQGTARALADQDDPDEDRFDGRALTRNGPVFYAGDGTGVAFQVPVRLGAGAGFFDAEGQATFGAVIDGAASARGVCAFCFEAAGSAQEALLALDINRDGDLEDRFDLGHLRMTLWDSADPDSAPIDAVVSPDFILQESEAYGSDLDNDGLTDPLFLLDADATLLQMRCFVLVQTRGEPRVLQEERSVLLQAPATD
jgi:hypothetical protein